MRSVVVKNATIENDIAKDFHKVEIFYNDNRLIDGDIVNPWDLVSTKYYIRYWRYFASKKCNLILELVVLKLLDKKEIKDNYDIYKLIIIWIQFFIIHYRRTKLYKIILN